MDATLFSDTLREFLRTADTQELITEIPSGSGLFRIANVPPYAFDHCFVSRNPGRFKPPGDEGTCFANNFDVCAKELGYHQGTDPTGLTFIYEKTTESISVVDIHKLPVSLQEDLYSDKSPDTKWEKSHVLMRVLREDLRLAEIRGAYYPSASGRMLQTGGSCLVLFDQYPAVSVIQTGDYAWWKSQQNHAQP